MRDFPTIVTWALENAETHATPVAIDEALAWFYGEMAKPEAQIAHSKSQLRPIVEKIKKIKDGGEVAGISRPIDAIKLMERYSTLQAQITYSEAQVAELEKAAAPLHAEYRRRGGWARYFIVKNENGHIHSSMQCQTCNREGKLTDFGWLTAWSGTEAKDLTAEVGPTACTVCFPWAETIRVEAEAAAKAAKKTAREELAAEKARVAAEKGITTPEGEKLFAGRDNDSWDVCKTLRTAEIAATDALVDLMLEQRTSKDPEFAYRYEMNGRVTEDIQMRIARHAWCLLRSIAAKKGLTFTEVFETHEAKAAAKLRKIDREWAKDPRNPNRSK